LRELFHVYPEAQIEINYDLNHSHNVFIDTLRMGRVFGNILSNAVQAQNYVGSLQIKTREASGFVEFTIGNTGSIIPEENLQKLFDVFFTSGKKGGTGLGLAIAKKIVESHGGTILCKSTINQEHPKGLVEFLFSLPTSNTLCAKSDQIFPKSSREIQATYAALKLSQRNSGIEIPHTNESSIEAELLQSLKRLNQTPYILFVDDEPIYRNGLISLVKKNQALANHLNVVVAKNDTEAFDFAKLHSPILIVQDVDLGAHSMNGIEVVQKLKASGFLGQVCIHSNRFLFEDNTIALQAGAQTVLPKPMSRVHLLKLILAAISKNTPANSQNTITPDTSELAEVVPIRLPCFAYIDDSKTMLMGMRLSTNGQATLHEFQTSKAFLDRISANPSFLNDLDFIVTDFHFAPSDSLNGLSLCAEIRRIGFQKPIYLASDAEVSQEDLLAAGMTRTIPKTSESWANLSKNERLS
jgi:CheY-like chemotaxis protein